jgi:signal transduction histidine kinase
LLVHDLKNIAGRLALLCRNLSAHFDDPLFRDSALGLLDETAFHLRDLAGELRERDGRLVVKLRVDLNRLLQDAVAERRPDLPRGVELMERYGALPPIWGDAFLLRSAFASAIENALEAMEGKGTLSICTRAERRRGRTRLVAEIADTGRGMSDESMRKCLAGPFHSTKEDGLGLGIYTIRQVAAIHDATVRIASAPRVGTRVRFSFPAEED